MSDDSLKARIDSLKRRIDDIEYGLSMRLHEAEEKIAGLEARVSAVATSYEVAESEHQRLEKRIAKLEDVLCTNGKNDLAFNRLDAHHTRIETVEQRSGEDNNRIDKLEESIRMLEDKLGL